MLSVNETTSISRKMQCGRGSFEFISGRPASVAIALIRVLVVSVVVVVLVCLVVTNGRECRLVN